MPITITVRQNQVLDLMKKGERRLGIARILKIHPLTVYCHQKALTLKGVVTAGTIHGVWREVVKGVRVQVEVRNRQEIARASYARCRSAWTRARSEYEVNNPDDFQGSCDAGRAAYKREALAIRRERDARRRAA